MKRRCISGRVALSCLCTVLAPSAVLAQSASAPVREISALRGDLYQAGEGGRITVFLVTADGIALADPLNPGFARWLKGELETRFPGRPVRYVLHSGHAHDRAAGALVFKDTAEIVAQDAFADERHEAVKSLPPSWTAFDRNQNSIIERSEAVALAPDDQAKDFDRDGEISAAEAWSDVAFPQRTFSRRRVIEIGGQHVELVHPDDGLGRDGVVILFREPRVLFAAAVPLHEAPESFASASPAAFAESLRRIERLPFDLVVAGDGQTGTVGDLALVREYVEALVAAVRTGFREGNSLEQVQAAADLNRFTQLRFMDARRGRNIAEAYRSLHLVRVYAVGAGQYTLLARGTPACASSAIPTIVLACDGVGGPTYGGLGGGTVMFGQYGGAIEISGGSAMTGHDQTFGSRVSTSTVRQTATAFLFRYGPASDARLRVVATAGFARVAATQTSDSFFIRTWRTTAAASIVGADLAIDAGRVRLLVPTRLTYAPATLFDPYARGGGQWSVAIGFGVAVPIVRVVIQ
jgi:hypothetical protein